jgi:hypothetical protein
MLISRAYAAGPEQPGMDAASPELFFLLLGIFAVPLALWAAYALIGRLRRAG